MADRIKIRRDNATNWTTNDPTLADGEIAWDSTNKAFRVGNGVDSWTSLPYLSGLSGRQILEKSANYTITSLENTTVYVDASGGAVTITLPDLATTYANGGSVKVVAQDATNTITVARAGSDTIANALTSVTLSSDRDYWTLEAGPDQWELVAGYETKADGVIKHHDGKMEQHKEVTHASYNLSAVGSVYRSTAAGDFIWTHSTDFSSVSICQVTCDSGGLWASAGVSGGSVTIYHWYHSTLSGRTDSTDVSLFGVWY